MTSDRAQSEFNMAVSYLDRLNALFYAADDASIGLDAHQWLHVLATIERELSTEMKETEVQRAKEMRDEIRTRLHQTTNRGPRPTPTIDPQVYDMLHAYEILLRNVMKAAGLQNRVLDDITKALK